MKPTWAAAALIALAISCAPKAQPPAVVNDCNKIAQATAAFTAPDAHDIVEARAIGATCATAIVLISVRKATGEPLWAWATPYGWPGRRDVNGSANDPGAMDEFLERWAHVRVDTTAALPDWPERENVFKGQLGAFMSTPFDRDQYLDIRSRAYPRLCHATGVESGLCVYYDTSSGAVLEVFQSGA